VIGVAVGPAAELIPAWRRERGATTGEVVHDRALMWLGPACNLGLDPADRLIPGWEIEAPAVTCWRCRNPQEAARMDAERGGAR